MSNGVGQTCGAVVQTFLGPPLARSAHKCDGFASSNPASTEQTQPPSCAIGNGGWRWINNGAVAFAFAGAFGGQNLALFSWERKTAISFTPEGFEQSRAGTPAGCKCTSVLLSGGVAALNRPANGCNASGVPLDNLEVRLVTT